MMMISREVVALWCLSSVRGPMVLGCYGGEGQWRKIDIVVWYHSPPIEGCSCFSLFPIILNPIAITIILVLMIRNCWTCWHRRGLEWWEALDRSSHPYQRESHTIALFAHLEHSCTILLTDCLLHMPHLCSSSLQATYKVSNNNIHNTLNYIKYLKRRLRIVNKL